MFYKSVFVERLPFAKFGVVGGWLLQKSRFARVVSFAKLGFVGEKLLKSEP